MNIEINKPLLGDCLELMPKIKDKSIDMILCDLPYNLTANHWDILIPFEKLWLEYNRIIKDNGAIVLTASQPFTSALIMSNLKMFRYEWVWQKERGSNFQNANIMPMKVHENVCVFYKKKPTYNKQFWYGDPYFRKPGKRKQIKGITSSNCSIYNPGTTNEDGKRNPITVLKFARENSKNNINSTQKPVALFEYLIKTYTNEGETVLDNCAGSFTTAIACLNTGRNYICIEKDEEQFKLGSDRIIKYISSL